MAEKFETMIPRDIITPSATLLGLIITALGILIATAGESNQVIVKNFAILFIIVVAVFVLAVVFTSLSSLFKKARLWTIALIFYIAGWSILGSILIIVLIGYAYGIEILQIQLPKFAPDLVSLISSLITGIITAFVIELMYERIRGYRKALQKLSEKVDVTKKDFDEKNAELQSSSLDLMDSLVLLRRDIEQELRRVYVSSSGKKDEPCPRGFRNLVVALRNRGVIDSNLESSLFQVYKISSRAVHGEDINKKDAMLIRELGIKVLLVLRYHNVKHKQNK
jgi:hypothetical protein